MILYIVFLIIGLVLILVGANALTDGSSSIAKRWGVSDLIIGLTVVAFGTSAPEFVISLMSALKGSSELAVGNVVGSNIFNILIIVGVTALVRPIIVERNILSVEIPMVLLSSMVLLAIGNSSLLDGAPDNMVTRVDGIILLLFFIIFMKHTFASAKLPAGPGIPEAPETEKIKEMSMPKAWIWVIAGLAALIFGGDCFVKGASGIASGLGVSEAVIGLTIVATGTSLPELATSITAALKGKTGIAIGNVIGSNLFNIFFVLGAAATARPLGFGSIGNLDLLTLTAASLLFWIFGWFFKERTITRWEGGILAALYVAYVIILVMGQI